MEIDWDNLPAEVNGVKRPERRCHHEIHESMRGKPLEKWHIRIYGDLDTDIETGRGAWYGDLIMSVFDKDFVSHDVLAVGCDGMLHLYRGLPDDIEGVKVDSLGRIVVET